MGTKQCLACSGVGGRVIIGGGGYQSMSHCHKCNGTGRVLAEADVPEQIIGRWHAKAGHTQSGYTFEANGQYSYYSATDMYVGGASLSNSHRENGSYQYSAGVLVLQEENGTPRALKVISSGGSILIGATSYSR